MLHGFSVDIEDWYHVENLASAIPRASWDTRESRIERNVDRLLELFASWNLRATCFILGYVARKHPRLVRKLAEAGHEIANHGEDHQLVYNQSPAEFRASVSDLRRYLEDLSGSPVVGFRAPCFSIILRSWWALDILAETGHIYDASIFPVRRARYGIAHAPLAPYSIRLHDGRSLAELPPSVLSLAGRTLPIAGGGYFRLYPYGMTRWAIRRLQTLRRPFFFYMHPWEIDPGQPKVRGVQFKAQLMHRLNLSKTENRVRRLLADFKFTTYRKVLAALPGLS